MEQRIHKEWLLALPFLGGWENKGIVKSSVAQHLQRIDGQTKKYSQLIVCRTQRLRDCSHYAISGPRPLLFGALRPRRCSQWMLDQVTVESKLAVPAGELPERQ